MKKKAPKLKKKAKGYADGGTIPWLDTPGDYKSLSGRKSKGMWDDLLSSLQNSAVGSADVLASSLGMDNLVNKLYSNNQNTEQQRQQLDVGSGVLGKLAPTVIGALAGPIAGAGAQGAQELINKQFNPKANPYQYKAKGGIIKGKGTAKSDSISAKLEKGSFVVPAENAKVAEDIRNQFLNETNTPANLKQKNGANVKLSNGEHVFTPGEKDYLLSKGVDLYALAPEADDTSELANGGDTGKDKSNPESDYWKNKFATQREQSIKDVQAMPDSEAKYWAMKALDGGQVPADKEALISNAISPKSNGKTSKLNLNSNLPTAAQTSNNLTTAAILPKPVGISQPDFGATKINTNALIKGISPTGNENVSPVAASNGNLLGNAGLGTILGIGQTLLGASELLRDGKRPVDSLSKDYTSMIDQAKAEATYGFDDATKQSYASNINDARLGATNFAANFAGGDPQKAQAEARAASGQYARNLLDLTSADNQLRLQKQQYSNSLINNKVERDRRLFEDKLNAFNVNQATGGNMVAAGITSLQNDAKNRRMQTLLDQIQAQNNGFTNNIGQSLIDSNK